MRHWSLQSFFYHALPSALAQAASFAEGLARHHTGSPYTSWSLATPQYRISTVWSGECRLSRSEGFHPLFDLSSLTKPLFLNMYLRQKYQSEFFHYIRQNITAYKDHRFPHHLTWDHFLSHRAGLAAWSYMQFYLQNPQAALNTWLSHMSLPAVTNYTCYSDLSYFILSRIMEDTFALRWDHVLDSMNKTLGTQFFHVSLTPPHPNTVVPYFPYHCPTAASEHKYFGLAHDTNAALLGDAGIVSGHAGLVGSVTDVALAVSFLAKHQALYTRSKDFENNPQARFCFGLDTPAGGASHTCSGLSAKHNITLSSHTYGHLGYSGTAFWFQTVEGDCGYPWHVFLCNRTACNTGYLHSNKSCFTDRVSIIEEVKSGQRLIALENSLGVELIQDKELEERQQQQDSQNQTWPAWDHRYFHKPADIKWIRQYIGNRLWNSQK